MLADPLADPRAKGAAAVTILIRGGTLISATSVTQTDVLVDGERVAALLEPGSALSAGEHRVIDATGKYVVPGGVDVHTHMEVPFGAYTAADTFESGTRAAAWGGTTTIVDFAVQRKGERIGDGLEAWHAKAEAHCAVDYGFHMIVGDVNEDALHALRGLVAREGITSFKLFMAYPGVYYSDDGQLLRAMQLAAEDGAMVMVHAENGPAIDVLVQQALEAGHKAAHFHSSTRPTTLEAEATNRAIALAEVARCPLYIVHLSAREAVEAVARARNLGSNVFGETCPQYLWLSLEEHLMRAGDEGAAYVCSTPLRSRAEGHQEALWRFLRCGDLSVVSTDHCPFCRNDKGGHGEAGFNQIPNGIGGVEHRLDLVYQGVAAGRLSLTRWVDLCATTPARLFGLHPRKGEIVPGADADVVVYDPGRSTTISASTHHMAVDHSAYEGFVVDGHVELVMSRGEVIVEAGTYLGRPGRGRYLRRGLPEVLR